MGDSNFYLIVVGMALAAIAIILILVCILIKCSKKCCKKNERDDYDNNLSTQQLIPPIFYTEIKDPLLQDDLMEKIPKDK